MTAMSETRKESAEAQPPPAAADPVEARRREFVRLASETYGANTWKSRLARRIGYGRRQMQYYAEEGGPEIPEAVMLALQYLHEHPEAR